jgi:hypothetical protein
MSREPGGNVQDRSAKRKSAQCPIERRQLLQGPGGDQRPPPDRLLEEQQRHRYLGALHLAVLPGESGRRTTSAATIIFAPGAAYHGRVLGAPILGRDGIRDCWQTKVVEGQGNIECELLNLYLDGETAIAEWEAEFDDRAQQVRKRMRGVALLVFDGH